MTEIAAGGIVWRESGKDVELLLVHRPSYDDWGFAKGKPHQRESVEQTALREVAEECGMKCRLGRPLGRIEYMRPDGTDKVVHMWAMEPVFGQFRPNREVDQMRWLPIEEAAALLTYDSDRHLLQGLQPDWREPSQRIFLVRHAEAGMRGSWSDDRNRPLTSRGWIQARDLVELLAPERVETLLTSPYTRCRQTLELLAEARGLVIRELEELAEDDPGASLAVLKGASGGTVMCSHGDVFPVMLDYLQEVGCRLDRRITDKGAVWIVDLGEDSVPERARYARPSA